MKNFFALFLVMLFSLQANAAMKYSDAYTVNDKIPMAVLVYSDYSNNYETILQQFKAAQSKLGDSYNYVELDISSSDFLDYNEKNVILTNIPYIMLYRDKGKFARVITRDCAANVSCSVPIMKSFIRK